MEEILLRRRMCEGQFYQIKMNSKTIAAMTVANPLSFLVMPHVRIHTVHACMHMHMHAYIRTYIQTYVQTHIRTYRHIHTWSPACVRSQPDIVVEKLPARQHRTECCNDSP